jgi:hypothetical protein
VRDVLRTSRTALIVGSALVIATLASWWLGIDEGGDPGGGASVATAGVIVIAFVKVWFVGRHFMELREAPLLLRLAFDVYVVAICTALCVIYAVTS